MARRKLPREMPAAVETRTEERDGVTYTVTVYEDCDRRSPIKTWGKRRRGKQRPRKTDKPRKTGFLRSR